MNKNWIENRIAKKEKTKIKIEIDLIYYSKLKYIVIKIKIRTKTWFLTQDSARIDQISRQIKGFSLREFEDKRWRSRINFSLFSQQNLTFKHSSDVEMSLEAKGSTIFKDGGVQTVWLLENIQKCFTSLKNISIYIEIWA